MCRTDRRPHARPHRRGLYKPCSRLREQQPSRQQQANGLRNVSRRRRRTFESLIGARRRAAGDKHSTSEECSQPSRNIMGSRCAHFLSGCSFSASCAERSGESVELAETVQSSVIGQVSGGEGGRGLSHLAVGLFQGGGVAVPRHPEDLVVVLPRRTDLPHNPRLRGSIRESEPGRQVRGSLACVGREAGAAPARPYTPVWPAPGPGLGTRPAGWACPPCWTNPCPVSSKGG